MKSYLQKHGKRKFIIGGAIAALLPVIIGISLLIIPILAQQDVACRRYGSTNVSMSCEFYRYIGEEFYWFMMLPIIVSFIFVAPFVAAKCVIHLRECTPFDWMDIFTTSIAKSTKANFWVAMAYNITLLVIFVVTAIGMSGASNVLITLITLFIFSIFIQFLLWLCITLPLAIICAGIFGIVVRPKSSYSTSTNHASATHKADP